MKDVARGTQAVESTLHATAMVDAIGINNLVQQEVGTVGNNHALIRGDATEVVGNAPAVVKAKLPADASGKSVIEKGPVTVGVPTGPVAGQNSKEVGHQKTIIDCSIAGPQTTLLNPAVVDLGEKSTTDITTAVQDVGLEKRAGQVLDPGQSGANPAEEIAVVNACLETTNVVNATGVIKEIRAEDWTIVSSKKGTPKNSKMQQDGSRDSTCARSSTNLFAALANMNDEDGMDVVRSPAMAISSSKLNAKAPVFVPKTGQQQCGTTTAGDSLRKNAKPSRPKQQGNTTITQAVTCVEEQNIATTLNSTMS
ncbi:hypothetical protein A4A49_31710 [Nicotiana attenuata]|uniref:Uncharacterized protein n=1 Tax=Nicotiana attenuata TaxID=49451 RepID=A0A1J6IMV8_NICAT|nr:hypothetical protein A4A49_31710 [Nicotiana attenuata]